MRYQFSHRPLLSRRSRCPFDNPRAPPPSRPEARPPPSAGAARLKSERNQRSERCSARSALNRRVSAARPGGSGVETTSAKAIRNLSANVSGNFTRSSGTQDHPAAPTGPPNRSFPWILSTHVPCRERKQDQQAFLTLAHFAWSSTCSKRICLRRVERQRGGARRASGWGPIPLWSC